MHDKICDYLLVWNLRIGAISWLWREGWAASAHGLLHTDLGRDEELLHGHHVHPREVFLHQGLAIVPVAQAEVLLEVDPELRDHDGVLQVHLNPFKPLDALVTGVPGAENEVHLFSELFRGVDWQETLTHSLAEQVPDVWQTWRAPSTK